MSTGNNTAKYIESTYVDNAGFSFKCVKGKKNEKVGAFGFI